MKRLISDVISEVARKHDLTYAQIISFSRRRALAWPRQEAMFQAYLECEHSSLPMIARIMGGRDHTTILHGIRAHCARSGYSYETFRRSFPKSHAIVTPNTFTAKDYREIVRVH